MVILEDFDFSGLLEKLLGFLPLSFDLIVLGLIVLSFVIGLKNHWIRNTIRLICFVAITFILFFSIKANINNLITPIQDLLKTFDIQLEVSIKSLEDAGEYLASTVSQLIDSLKETITSSGLEMTLPEISEKFTNPEYYTGLVTGAFGMLIFPVCAILSFIASYIVSLIIWIPIKIILSIRKEAKAKELGIDKIKMPFWQRLVSSGIRVMFSLIAISMIMSPVSGLLIEPIDNLNNTLERHPIDFSQIDNLISTVDEKYTELVSMREGLVTYNASIADIENTLNEFKFDISDEENENSIVRMCNSANELIELYDNRLASLYSDNREKIDNNTYYKNYYLDIKQDIQEISQGILDYENDINDANNAIDESLSQIDKYHNVFNVFDDVKNQIDGYKNNYGTYINMYNTYKIYLTKEGLESFNLDNYVNATVFKFLLIINWGADNFEYEETKTSIINEINSITKTLPDIVNTTIDTFSELIETLLKDEDGNSYLDYLDEYKDDFNDLKQIVETEISNFNESKEEYKTLIEDAKTYAHDALDELESYSSQIDDFESQLGN